MSDKKRKKSYTVLKKKEQQEFEAQQKKHKRNEIILMCVIAVLIVAFAFGLVFGVRALIRSSRKDWCDYRDTIDVSKHETYIAEIKVKDYGTVRVLLDKTAAPVTVNNFIALANKGIYDGAVFDTVMKDFKIQVGKPAGDAAAIEGEFSSNDHNGNKDISHIKGVISMYRDGGNDSASSVFFICNSDDMAKELDGKYAAFGYVISGLSVIDDITKDTKKYADDNGFIADKTKCAVIESVRVSLGGDSSNETEPDIINP